MQLLTYHRHVTRQLHISTLWSHGIVWCPWARHFNFICSSRHQHRLGMIEDKSLIKTSNPLTIPILISLDQSLVERRWVPLDALKSVPTSYFTLVNYVYWAAAEPKLLTCLLQNWHLNTRLLLSALSPVSASVLWAKPAVLLSDTRRSTGYKMVLLDSPAELWSAPIVWNQSINQSFSWWDWWKHPIWWKSPPSP